MKYRRPRGAVFHRCFRFTANAVTGDGRHGPTYEEKCTTCIWGYPMAVEMIIDQWNPGSAATEPRHSATALVPAPSTGPGRRARFPAVTE